MVLTVCSGTCHRYNRTDRASSLASPYPACVRCDARYGTNVLTRPGVAGPCVILISFAMCRLNDARSVPLVLDDNKERYTSGGTVPDATSHVAPVVGRKGYR